MPKDLHEYLSEVKRDQPSEIIEIDHEVSLDCEISATAMSLENSINKPILLFKNVLGYQTPIVTNLFADKNRIARLLGFNHANELIEKWSELSAKRVKPKVVGLGRKENYITYDSDIDLTVLPIPKHFETDVGPYITAGVCFAKDPDSGIGNLSYARLQVKSKDKFGLSLHSRGNLWDFQQRSEKNNKALDIAIVIGMNPAINVAAATRLPLGEDEIELAGALIKEPIELMPCNTVDINVPIHSEIIIEGKILPNVREDEGPFGEYTGYSTSRSTRNVMQVTSITQKKDMIYHDITPGAASDHLNLSKISRVPQFFNAVKKVLPNVVAMNYPSSGTHYHCYLAIKSPLRGQPQHAMTLLFANDIYLKLVVVVDEDIDVYDEQQVLWALATRFQADKDLMIIDKMPCNLLDPSSENGISAKIGLDATKKFGNDVIALSFSSDLMRRVAMINEEINRKL